MRLCNPNAIDLNGSYVVAQFGFGLLRKSSVEFGIQTTEHAVNRTKGTCLNTELVWYSEVHCISLRFKVEDKLLGLKNLLESIALCCAQI